MVSSQHAEGVDLDGTLSPEVKKFVVDPILENMDLDSSKVRLLVNPTGNFVVGGPMGDAGITGRKITCDSYRGWARYGRRSLVGTDP